MLNAVTAVSTPAVAELFDELALSTAAPTNVIIVELTTNPLNVIESVSVPVSLLSITAVARAPTTVAFAVTAPPLAVKFTTVPSGTGAPNASAML